MLKTQTFKVSNNQTTGLRVLFESAGYQSSLEGGQIESSYLAAGIFFRFIFPRVSAHGFLRSGVAREDYSADTLLVHRYIMSS